MAFQPRGGFPDVWLFAASSTPASAEAAHIRFRGRSTHLRVKTRTNPVRMYFTLEDYNAGTRYVELEVHAGAHSEVLDEPWELEEVWLVGVGGTADVELVATLKS